jgi:hypothetical protein
VVAVHQDLGLHDGDQPSVLAGGGEAGQGLGIGGDAAVGGDALADGDDRPPLGEPGPQLAVLDQPVEQAIQALGDLLTGKAGQGGGAGVDLDAGDDALVLEDLGQGGAAGRPLAQGLVVEDDPADELVRPWVVNSSSR